MTKEISSKTYLKEYNYADKVIRYLLNPGDDSIELTDTEKKNLDHCKQIHTLRYQFHKKKDIVLMMGQLHGIKERQVYNLIHETEKIFGKVEGINRDYERNFLVDQSRKNIELAMASRNSPNISKALLAHYKMVGLEEFVPDMPDFAHLEQHKYIVNLPANFIEALKQMIRAGSVKISDILPPPSMKTEGFEEAQEIHEPS